MIRRRPAALHSRPKPARGLPGVATKSCPHHLNRVARRQQRLQRRQQMATEAAQCGDDVRAPCDRLQHPLFSTSPPLPPLSHPLPPPRLENEMPTAFNQRKPAPAARIRVTPSKFAMCRTAHKVKRVPSASSTWTGRVRLGSARLCGLVVVDGKPLVGQAEHCWLDGWLASYLASWLAGWLASCSSPEFSQGTWGENIPNMSR